MDATYLQATIGPLLATGLAEVTAVRPADPVDYLAQYLLKSTEAGKEAAALAEAKAVATRAEEAKRDAGGGGARREESGCCRRNAGFEGGCAA